MNFKGSDFASNRSCLNINNYSQASAFQDTELQGPLPVFKRGNVTQFAGHRVCFLAATHCTKKAMPCV